MNIPRACFVRFCEHTGFFLLSSEQQHPVTICNRDQRFNLTCSQEQQRYNKRTTLGVQQLNSPPLPRGWAALSLFFFYIKRSLIVIVLLNTEDLCWIQNWRSKLNWIKTQQSSVPMWRQTMGANWIFCWFISELGWVNSKRTFRQIYFLYMHALLCFVDIER